jgi:HEAT repeats
MVGEQLDLFVFDRILAELSRLREEVSLRPAEMDDGRLLAALPHAGLLSAPLLAAEATRRRLDAAIPALERLCRRLIGFGTKNVVPEQAAALKALLAIGGEGAKRAVGRIVAERIVQGPTLAIALDDAARLGASVPPSRLAELIGDPDRGVRAGACRCVRSGIAVTEELIDLLDDLRPDVVLVAACALGRIGRKEARPHLLGFLRREPSAEVIDALVGVANEETIVALGRVARRTPELARAVLDALEAIDDPRALAAAAPLKRELP